MNVNEIIKNVRVKVFAGARREKFISPARYGGVFEIYVREPAQKNLANMRVRELVAENFGISPNNVQILTGLRSPKKCLKVKINNYQSNKQLC